MSAHVTEWNACFLSLNLVRDWVVLMAFRLVVLVLDMLIIRRIPLGAGVFTKIAPPILPFLEIKEARSVLS